MTSIHVTCSSNDHILQQYLMTVEGITYIRLSAICCRVQRAENGHVTGSSIFEFSGGISLRQWEYCKMLQRGDLDCMRMQILLASGTLESALYDLQRVKAERTRVLCDASRSDLLLGESPIRTDL